MQYYGIYRKKTYKKYKEKGKYFLKRKEIKGIMEKTAFRWCCFTPGLACARRGSGSYGWAAYMSRFAGIGAVNFYALASDCPLSERRRRRNEQERK